MPYPPGSWTLTKAAWDELECTDYLHCVDKLRTIMRTLEERTENQYEKLLSTLQRDTWANLLEFLLSWHSKIGDGMAKYGVYTGAGFFIADQQAMCDWMKDLRLTLNVDLKETMFFVNATYLGRGEFQDDEQFQAATAARKRFVTTVKELPDFAARKAIAELYRAMKDPETQKFGRKLLNKNNESKDDSIEAWQVYAKKRWDDVWGEEPY